ncbi:MAG: dipeptidase [Planctomycetota bacterium]|nr:dipeptidase [Planctomycetota bacterium]
MNAKIARDREAGLAVLKPDAKDLERGLALHREGPVIESYGFVPMGSPDRATALKALDEGMPAVAFDDLLEEMRQTRVVHDPEERAEALEAWEASGLHGLLLCAGQEDATPERLLQRMARYTYMLDGLREHLVRALSAEDIEAARKAGKRAVVLTCNAVPLANRWVYEYDELYPLRLFYQLGARMMHLCYQRRNAIGDGCGEPGNAGLSEFGKAVVREMNRLGVLVDLAHSGWRTCLEAARASTRPVVVSHSGAHALNAHIRLKPDEVIKAVAETGGYVGVVAIPHFLGRSGDLNALLDHVAYIAKLAGPDHVAIGTDVSYTTQACEKAFEGWPPHKSPPRWYSLWPAGSKPSEGKYEPWQRQSLSWTNRPLFTVGLAQRGFKDEEIRKIIGGNVLRVLREVQKDTSPTWRAWKP